MREGRRLAVRSLVLGLVLAATVGCVRGCKSGRPPIHPVPNMDYQPKYEAQAASDFFYDGKTMREPVPGTVARGELHEDEVYFTGKTSDGAPVAAAPVEVDEPVLERGEDRYSIYCAPCHDPRGTGKGVLVERGVPTTSLHEAKVVEAPDGHLFDVITNGLGLMPSYAYPIPPEDRWAIVVHVRRLQERYGP